MSDIVIVGAGPYGLSIAAHLRRRGIDYRIFGTPMENWATKMPRGMLLKSDGFASNLSDPGRGLTLAEYCRGRDIPYADEGVPVSAENFIAYGEAFQRRFVPDTDPRRVTGLGRSGDRFSVTLDDGEIVSANRVVIGVGISDFPFLPAHLSHLPPEYLTHSSHHGAIDAYKGREVAVIGSGSSATDVAALLHENGAAVTMIARRPELQFHTLTDPATRTMWDRIRNPGTGIGPGWRSVFYCQAPLLFRHLPEAKRLGIVATSHGPAGGWPMRERVLGKFPILNGWAPHHVEIRDNRIHLQLASADGATQEISADHAIACTGYKVDLRKVAFLDDRLRVAIAQAAHTPILSSRFESSVPGLYFVGPASANSFGPMFRFVYGAEFTAFRVVADLARSAARRPAAVRPALAAR